MGAGDSQPIDYDKFLLDDEKSQSLPVEGGDEKDCTPIRRMKGCEKNEKLEWVLYPDSEKPVTTLYDLLLKSGKEHADKPLYGTQLYQEGDERGDVVWVDYKTFLEEVTFLGKGFRSLGIEPKGNIGIYSINRVEWCYTAWASYTQSLRNVALYDTLGPEAVAYIIGHAELRLVCCSKDKLKNVFSVKQNNPDIPLKYVVQFDPDERYNNTADTIDDVDKKEAEDLGLELIAFSDVIKAGRESEFEPTPPTSDDLAFLMYTSGTTGLPKGVMLSHQNLVAVGAASLHVFGMMDTDTHISYLTLAHIFETVIHVLMVNGGGKIGFFRGDFKKIVDDFMKLEPTILCGVPRVYQRLYDRVISKVQDAQCVKRYFFNKALRDGARASLTGGRVEKYDKQIWVKIRTQMGLQNVRVIVTGSAPIQPYLLEFLKVAIGCPIIQGYGLTETAAGACVSLPTDFTIGHCGPPLSCNEIKLVDVPAMNYLSTDEPCPRGEVLIRGPNVCSGYYKNDEATEKAFPGNDGFFATGDVGRWNKNGTLSIIDRKKNIFKLSQGEYVAAEKIEGVYNKSASVNQVWVYGNSYKSFVVAVVVPSVEWVLSNAKNIGKCPEMVVEPNEEFRATVGKYIKDNHDAIRDLVLADMRKHQQDLKGFEKVKDILLESELDDLLQGFNVDNDTLTPSFKLKRPQLTKKYVEPIKELYTKHDQAPVAGEMWGGE